MQQRWLGDLEGGEAQAAWWRRVRRRLAQGRGRLRRGAVVGTRESCNLRGDGAGTGRMGGGAWVRWPWRCERAGPRTGRADGLQLRHASAQDGCVKDER